MLKIVLPIVLLVAAGIVFVLMQKATESSTRPTIRFTYGEWIDDYLCPYAARKRIRDADRKKINPILDKMDRHWQKEGTRLLIETARVLKRRFAYSEKKVPVFLCSAMSSWPFPAMASVHNFKVDPDVFVDAVFHALLHRLVLGGLAQSIWNGTLSTIEQTSWSSLSKVHVYSVQKKVYEKLKLSRMWAKARRQARYAPIQWRAIEIVEKKGTDVFISELHENL